MDLVSRTCGAEIRVMTSCMRLDTQQIENIEAKISNTRPRCPTEMQPVRAQSLFLDVGTTNKSMFMFIYYGFFSRNFGDLQAEIIDCLKKCFNQNCLNNVPWFCIHGTVKKFEQVQSEFCSC
ncbi:unnamed protein product [Triticum turgidum subsp. durum]|uniref:Uncharacterized protein n=1 Tax=Triticum turgidum subsp. durum TaxID=4567 RepID=A0A9R1S905_TRITD|nr:unnamed protein product [Triticum turgidum subsp. durum]